MAILVQTSKLSKKYKGQSALHCLNMQIEQGDIYGLVGRNGAGKTTLIKILFGLANPTSGEFNLFGVANNDRQILNARRKMNGIIEQPTFYSHMNARENLKTFAYTFGTLNDSSIEEALNTVGLGQTGKKKVKNFSLGMKQRLGIARALLTKARLIILDEPTNGLDPEGIIGMRELIKKLNTDFGITFMISSHYIMELEHVINKLGIISQGEMVEETLLKEVQSKLTSYICIHTDYREQCQDVLIKRYPKVRMAEEKIIIEQTVDDIGELWRYLSGHGIVVRNIDREEGNLEEYVLKSIGGFGITSGRQGG